MLLGFAIDVCERRWSIISCIIFFTFLNTGEIFAYRLSSGTSPRANDSLKMSANIGKISLLYLFSTLSFSPSRPGALCTYSLSNSLATHFGSNVMSSMDENGQAPSGDGSESASHVKTYWNLNINNVYFDNMGSQIYPLEL